MTHTPLLRLLALAFAAALILAACYERSQPEQAKVAAATVAPATPPAAPPVADAYPATLAEGIDFSKPGYPDFLASANGMSGHEPWGRWSDGTPVAFQFKQPLPARFTLALTAHAFDPNIGAPIQVRAGASEQTLTLAADDQTCRLDFALAAPADRLEFSIPQPTSPAELKQGEDPRKLGIGLVKLRIESDVPAAVTAALPVYAARIATSATRIEVEQGNFAPLTFTVTNQGSLTWSSELASFKVTVQISPVTNQDSLTWSSEPPNPVNFSWHLLDSDGKTLTFDNPRAVFPQPVAPGQGAELTVKLGADLFPGPGQYRLEFDLVHEGHLGLNEWDDREGQPKGSPWYSGNAGVLARALVEGYFGVDSRHDVLYLSPRLKQDQGAIALREPATGRRIAYDYRYDSIARRLSLTLWTDHPGPVKFVLTLPAGLRAAKTLTVNGHFRPLQIQSTGEDGQAVFTLASPAAKTVIAIR